MRRTLESELREGVSHVFVQSEFCERARCKELRLFRSLLFDPTHGLALEINLPPPRMRTLSGRG